MKPAFLAASIVTLVILGGVAHFATPDDPTPWPLERVRRQVSEIIDAESLYLTSRTPVDLRVEVIDPVGLGEGAELDSLLRHVVEHLDVSNEIQTIVFTVVTRDGRGWYSQERRVDHRTWFVSSPVELELPTPLGE